MYQYTQNNSRKDTSCENAFLFSGETFRFTSKELDSETGFYCFGPRYYDSRLGGFISADAYLPRYLPTGDKDKDANLPGMGGVFNPINLSLYCYTHNNPVRYVDPDGNATALNVGEMSLLDRYESQKKVMNDPEYVQGAGGHLNATNPLNTWCNQSTFDVIIGTGGDISKYVIAGGRNNTRANDSVDAMNASAAKGNLKIIDGRTAQKMANEGYTVVAGWKNTAVDDNGRPYSGHVATVASST